MFDPGTVRRHSQVVLVGAVYTFQGAYAGEQEFFEGRPVLGDWRNETGLIEIADLEGSVVDVETLDAWNPDDPPGVVVRTEREARDDDGPER